MSLPRRQFSPRKCQCGCGQHPRAWNAEYVRGHRPPSADADYRQKCSVTDCTSAVGRKGARGLCSRHYQRRLKTGSPTGTSRTPTIERFMTFVTQAGDCWEWTGTRDQDGYGMFSDRPKYRWITRSHRWSYEFFIADIPDGLDLDHLCRNRACVNPWHLEPVTNEVNARRGAEARRKDVCPASHPYDAQNTYINPLGRRVCRICKRASQNRYDKRRRAA